MSMQLGARTQAVIVLALVATLGALVGILGDRLVARRAEPQQPVVNVGAPEVPGRGMIPGRGMQAGNQLRYAEWLADVLELTPAQRAAIDSIVTAGGDRVRAVRQELEPRLREIARETRTSIDQVLTDTQRQQLRAMRQERVRNMRPNPGRRGG